MGESQSTPPRSVVRSLILGAVACTVISAVLIVCHVFLKPLLAVLLFVIGPVAALAFEYLAFEQRNRHVGSKSDSTDIKNSATARRPNLQVWGLGVVMGAGLAVVYIAATVSLTLLEKVPLSELAVWQHIGQAAITFLALAFVVWAAVRICSAE